MARVERVVVGGVDGGRGDDLVGGRVGDFVGSRNVWLFGDESAAVVIDPAGPADEIGRALGDREAVAIVGTSAGEPLVDAAVALGELLVADVALPAADRELWERQRPGWAPQILLDDGVVLQAGETVLRAILTPGVTPGAVCLYDGEGHLFTGATLTDRGRQHPAIVRERLLRLPPDTQVLAATGEVFTLAEAALA